MRNLRATVSFLVAPSAGATVGQVRGDIEKLASTIGAIDGSDTVPDAMGKALSDARDDDPFSEVAAEAAAPAHRLGGAFDAVAQHLACDQTPSG